MRKETPQYTVAKKLTDKGFGVIALIPIWEDIATGKMTGGKIPSSRSNKFTDLDEKGNPKQKVEDGALVVKNNKPFYEYEYGGGKNPIFAGEEDRLYKVFCDEEYTTTKISKLNVGIITGDTGVVAIDIDGEEGFENLEILQAKYGQLPKTLTATTGRDRGCHMYYKTPKVDGKFFKMGSKCNFLCKKVDYKGDNGYTVAPPSQHKSLKRYTWDRDIEDFNIDMLPELPEWVVTLLIGEQWHSRDDGLFEEESKKYREEHSKRVSGNSFIVKTQFTKVSEAVYPSGFYCRMSDEVFHIDAPTGYSHYELNCPMHQSDSKESFHIDDKGDHFEWWCWGCSIGGRAYTADEYKQYMERQEYFQYKNQSLAGDGFLLDNSVMDDFSVPKKEKTTETTVAETQNADPFFNLPENIEDGISPEEFGETLKKIGYRKDIIPSFLSDYVEHSCEGRKDVRATILLGILSNYCSLMGTRYRVKPNPNSTWDEPTLLWASAVGKSGSQKSGIKKRVDAPFKPVHNLMKKEDVKINGAHKLQLMKYKKDFKLWEADANAGDPPPAPDPHKYPKMNILKEDETLANLQKEAVFIHRGMFFNTDEIMALFESFGALSNNAGYVQKTLLKAYDSYENYEAGRSSVDSRNIPRWHIGMFGFAVIDDFRDYMLQKTNTKDGWSARFLVSLMPQIDLGNDYGERDDPDMTYLKNASINLYAAKPEYIKETNSIKSKVMMFNTEAQAYWQDFDDKRAKLMNNCPKLQASFYESTYSKMIGQAARLSAIIHLIRFNSGSCIGLSETTIDLFSVKAGCYLAMYFHKHMFELLFGEKESENENLTELDVKVYSSFFAHQCKHNNVKTLDKARRGLRVKAIEIKASCDRLIAEGYGTYIDSGKMFVAFGKNKK